jgi:hypothetical protein
MQHLTPEELIEFDDRSASGFDKERDHLKACALCYHEYSELKSRRLRLRALPMSSPRHSAWPSVQRRIYRRRALTLAAQCGAVATLVVSAVLFVYRTDPVTSDPPLPRELVAESQALERALQRAEANAVTDLHRAKEIVAVEQQIADVDDQIEAFQSAGEASGSTPLWHARVQLLRTLLQMHQPTSFVSL